MSAFFGFTSDSYTPAKLVAGLGQCLTYMVKEYVVNLNNHILLHFLTSTRRHARKLLETRGVDKQRSKYLIFKLLEAYEASAELAPPLDAREDLTLILEDMKIHAKSQHLMLKRMFEHLKAFEIRQEKVFNLLPIYSNQAKYVTIDTDALYGLLGAKAGTRVDLQRFASEQNNNWGKIFKLPRGLLDLRVGHRKSFDYIIKTDGVGVSIGITSSIPCTPLSSSIYW